MAKKAPASQASAASLKYPYYGLPQALKMGAAVKEHGGNRAGVPKSVIAQAMGTDQGASSFAQQVASAKTWGVVDGLTELRLTEQAQEYYFPTSDESKRISALSFLIAPTAFTFLIERFDGSKLPSLEILANLLGKHARVPPSWTSRAAGMFVSAAQELDLFDSNGFFRYGANLHNAGRPGAKRIASSADSASDHAISTATAIDNEHRAPVETPRVPGANVWVYSEGGGTLRLETPEPIPVELWKRLKKYVDVLEPAGAAEGG